MGPCPEASPWERLGGEGAPPRTGSGSDFVVHVVDEGDVFNVRGGFLGGVHDRPRVHAQMLDKLAFDGVAQFGGFVEQGTVGQLRHLCGYGYEDIKELLSKE